VKNSIEKDGGTKRAVNIAFGHELARVHHINEALRKSLVNLQASLEGTMVPSEEMTEALQVL
ncbi:hypothetical protein T484DRAFT_1867674, partial [Baffinella frigidus]